METYTQQDRPIAIETPLGTDALLLSALEGEEEMSRLFRFELHLQSSELDFINPADIVGKNVTFLIRDRDEDAHYFNGFVRRFAYMGQDDRLSLYTAEIVPWLWFLTRVTNCRIFQKKTVPDILEEVFQDHGFKDFELKLERSYPERDYCVQYRETDFSFVSRLMEEEGIFYFFIHEDGKHTLILGDDTSAYEDCPDDDDGKIDMSSTLRDHGQFDQIITWEHAFEYRSGKIATRDFNFERPGSALQAEKPTLVKLDNIQSFELYDYPGSYEDDSDGDALAKIRMEEEETPFDVFAGTSVCRGFHPGYKFAIVKHHCREEEGKSYVLTSVRHKVSVGSTYETLTNGNLRDDTQEYHNQYRCIPDTSVFRPARTTPEAVVHGVQTAIVVGPSGEEIYTDEHGRVKVQFHWDRDGQSDENSSCWVRVAQHWAGQQWGTIFIPRIGQEVIIEFLEGDPDRPIITGRVYNGDNKPPFELPDNKTQSGIKTRSTQDGSADNFNEIRFEDKKGEEQLFIHAEKNQDIEVENDETHWVGNDRTKTVDRDEKTHVKRDRTETVDRNEKITIGNNRTESVKKDESIKIGNNRSEEVGEDESIGIGGDQTINVGKNRSVQIGESDSIAIGKTLVLDAGDEIMLKTGSAKIVMKKDGSISIEGKDITIKGSGKINMKASSDIKMKGSKIAAN